MNRIDDIIQQYARLEALGLVGKSNRDGRGAHRGYGDNNNSNHHPNFPTKNRNYHPKFPIKFSNFIFPENLENDKT